MSEPTSGGRRFRQLKNTSVVELKGVGARKAAALEQMGLPSILDLLMHYPRRHADRRNAIAIAALRVGEEAVVTADVRRVEIRRPRGRAPIVEVVVADSTGTLVVSFFNQPWRARALSAGMTLVVFGKVEEFRGRRQMTNPLVDNVGDQTGRLVPIYPQSGKAGIGSIELASYITEALERAGTFFDPVPVRARSSIGLIDRTAAFGAIHNPHEMEDFQAARRRPAFDELFRIQVALIKRRQAEEATARGIAHLTDRRDGLVARFLSSLPFALTGAQQRAVRAIASDLAAPPPMHRLLQGDVGSGKTVVALAALLYGVEGRFQGALMVPTEVLAEQHFLLARELLGNLSVDDPTRLGGTRPLAVALLTSRTTGTARTRLVRELATGAVDVVIGTHALLTDDVGFHRLGVVVIDEQHRFGVDQRAALREKASTDEGQGVDPDLLVMTATPIPRTAAMTFYGDLDESVIDELPAGRTPVRTSWLGDDDEGRVWEAVNAAVAEGHQVFVVCPLVRPGERDDDGTDDGDEEAAAEDEPRLFDERFAERRRRPPRSATEEYERLRAGPLASARVGLLHGQLPQRDKELVMAAFRRGELDVVVATTVIEVGVDIANATVMVIEDADRFGIAQLHQLRGRVGRGSAPARCFLLANAPTPDGERRLDALCSTNDGFELAGIDLELRGEGTVLGVRQKGRSDLRLASLRRDRDLVEAARTVAGAIVTEDPELERHEYLRDEIDVLLGENEAYLFRS